MVAVDTGRDGRLRQAAGHELQESHLRRGVLHVDPVRLELQIGLATDVAAAVGVVEQVLFGVVQMAVEDLFGEREAAGAQNSSYFGIFRVEGLVGGGQGRAGRETAGALRAP